MKSILMSIQPKWVAKILNGEKTIEVRKSIPKCELPITVYIYCTKGDKNNCLEYADNPDKTKEGKWCLTSGYPYANGKVVAKFTLNKVEEIYDVGDDVAFNPVTSTMLPKELLEASCLSYHELGDYLNYGYSKKGYAWHIDNLEVLKTPRYLNEGFFQPAKTKDQVFIQTYRRPPQSWCYVLYKKGFNNEQIRRKQSY